MFLLGVKKRMSVVYEEADEQFIIKKKVLRTDNITIENINLPAISAKFPVPVKVHYFGLDPRLIRAHLKFRLNESHAGCPRGEFEVHYLIPNDLFNFDIDSRDNEKGDIMKIVFTGVHSRPEPCLECHNDYDDMFANLPSSFWEGLIDFLKRKVMKPAE